MCVHQFPLIEIFYGTTMAANKKEDLFKFPRTRHLFDAGGNGVSRDDLLMDVGEEQLFYSRPGPRGKQQLVAIEEKVDGANLGISIGADMTLKVQNRSHYVNSKTHRQFSNLDTWLSENSAALYEILEPGRHVLFGEWLYAKHSVHYTRLPGYFMAFDLYDKEVGKFYSWRERNRRLDGSGIPIVRQIAETTISGREEVCWRDDTEEYSLYTINVWFINPLLTSYPDLPSQLFFFRQLQKKLQGGQV